MVPCGRFLALAHKKEQCGKNQVDHNDQKNGHDHRPCRGAADLLGAGPGGESFQAADGGDGDAKHDALDQSGDDITQEQRVKRGPNVAREGEEESDEGKNGESADADVEGLRDGALKADGFALEGSNEGVVSGAATEGSE